MKHDLNLPGYDELLQIGLNALPEGVDKSENSFYYPLISAAALQGGEQMVNAQFVYTSMFADSQTGTELDAFVGDRTSLKRRKAVRTKGEVTFTGEDGTYIPQGALVGIGADGKQFATLYGDVVADGTVTIDVEAVEIGYLGYIDASAVDTLVTPIAGINAVTNAKAMQSGVDDESDADFLERYRYHLANFAYNLNNDTFVEWAGDVEGVGQVRPVGTKDSNRITVYALDSAFEPASEELSAKLQAMYNNKLPYGFQITVAAPAKEFVSISISVKEGYPSLASDIKDALVRYIKTYPDPRWIRTDLSIWEVINVVEQACNIGNVLEIVMGDGSPNFSLSATDGSKLLAIGNVSVTTKG